MPSLRTTSALAAAALTAALLGAVAATGRGGATAPVVATSGGRPAATATGAVAPAGSAVLAGAPESAEADWLEAVRTVALYCHLVEARQFARAGELCERRRLWSRRALAGLRRFHFCSAGVYAAPDTRTLVLRACVRVRAGRGRPLPDGLADCFFTLGRAGSSVGGWLITAVSTRP